MPPCAPNDMLLRESAIGEAVKSQTHYAPLSATGPAAASASRKLTMKDVAEECRNGRMLITIHAKAYDVTEFMEKHPGGKLVLQNMIGKDATDAFENYHRAAVAKFQLPRYLYAEVSDAPVPLAHVADFRKVRQELLKRGLFETQPTFYRNLHLWLASLLGASLYLSLVCTSLSMHLAGAAIMGLFWQQFAGYGHDLGHTNVSKSFCQDHYFGSVIGASLTGLSTAWWKNNHNTHHVVPNSVEHDPDIQHMPLMAISDKVIEEPYYSTYYNRHVRLDWIAALFVGNQHLLFFPLMAVARFNLYAQGLIMLLTPSSKTPFRWHEIGCILVFFSWVAALALQMPTWFQSIAWVLLSHAVSGILHIQIVISHWAMETYNESSSSTDKSDMKKKDKSDKNKSDKDDLDYDSLDWYELQLRTTMDIDCPAWFDWAHLGLQFQIEHHLYPTLPRPSLRIARELVEEVCKKHGLPYHSMTFSASVYETWRMLSETAALARSGEYTRNLLTEALQAEG